MDVHCRSIFGPMHEGGQWRKWYSRELKELYSEPNIVNVMKSSRLRWVGRVVRMADNELRKRYCGQTTEVT